MTRNLVCSECGGAIHRGIIVETIGIAEAAINPPYWMEGGRESNFLGGLKTKGKKKHYITAYRCESCGFLKLYAGPDNSGTKK